MVTVAVFTVLNIPRVVLAALEVIRIINYAECQEHGYVYNPSDITITFYNVVRLCTFINSSLNFTIYCATVRQFREDLRQKILHPLVKVFVLLFKQYRHLPCVCLTSIVHPQYTSLSFRKTPQTRFRDYLREFQPTMISNVRTYKSNVHKIQICFI